MICVVIPSYKVKEHILGVIKTIGSEVEKIIVVDDKCPHQTGKFVQENCNDERVVVIYNEINQGVGGAVKAGYKKALELGATIVVKLDGDGQMDSNLIPTLIRPIVNGNADYVKGNRFFHIQSLHQMPFVRLFGNSVLSLINKFVNGYWNIMDPTNGFTAIHHKALKRLPLEIIANRYFFESDMLFRLSLERAVVVDFPMDAKYAEEKSNLRISRILFEFPPKYIRRFFIRIFYQYFLRDFNAASVELLLGSIFFLFGSILGTYKWLLGIKLQVYASAGTVMLAALPVILGFQLLLSALNFDLHSTPKTPLQKSDF